jgi:hypothetical protein
MRLPTHLTDSQLIEGLKRCASRERGATAALVACLAEVDARHLHLAAGFPSLFAYCCEVLHLSESAAYNRIEVARAVRRFPSLLDRMVAGSHSLATARLLAPHLTRENHRDLLDASAGLGKRAVEELVARRFPKPDVTPLVRKLPAANALAELRLFPSSEASPALPAPPPSPPSPLVVPLAPDRYLIRFTASAATRDKLRMARDLLRHAIPDGDPAEIIDRALALLIADLSRKKAAQVATPVAGSRPTGARSRHIPAIVRRAVWTRDQGRCAFVAPSGWRCRERGRLEFHHVRPFAVGGGATVANIQLRCRAHNGHEATVFFGPRPGASWVAGAARDTGDSA